MFRKAVSIPRLRLATQLTLFVVFVVLITMVTAYLVVVRSEQAFEYRKAERRAETLRPALEGGLDAIPGMAWVVPPRGPVPEAPPQELVALAAGHHILERAEGPQHAVVRDLGEGRRSIVLYSSVPHLEQRAMLLRILAGAALVLVAATVALSPVWAGFLLRHDPIVRRRIGQQMQDAAREAFRSHGAEQTTLARTYTEYVRLLYDPDERSREFIANVAHELRTPITLVRSGCEVIAGAPELGPRHGRRLAQMIGALDHMNETIRSFLILARQGDWGPFSRVPVAALVAEVAAMHRTEAEAAGVAIELGPVDVETVEAPREALTIVLSNLVRNAVRHGAHPGRVEISFERGIFRVRDDGPGIAEGERASIFQPFFRARRAAEQGVFGLGLGLAIVKRVCDACGWMVDVVGEAGGGATFLVTLRRA